ncbi:uncharacterized protein [Antedon mediterranea]|uniref:uncharacterized protein n=1 Tax=Antedon mediterranea TaxID=105859 RepID=UPI003AF8C386
MTQGSHLRPPKKVIETLRSSPQILRRKLFSDVTTTHIQTENRPKAVFDLFYLGQEEITTLQLSQAITAVRGKTMQRQRTKNGLKSTKCKLRIYDSNVVVNSVDGCDRVIELNKIAYCALDQRFPSVVLLIARQPMTDKLFVHMLLCGKTEEATDVVRTMELTFQDAWKRHVELKTNNNEYGMNSNETLTRRKQLITLAAIGNNSMLTSTIA